MSNSHSAPNHIDQIPEMRDDIPATADMATLIRLAGEKGVDAFVGRQVVINGDILPQQLLELTASLDHEIALVRLGSGTRMLAVGERRDFAPSLQEFQDSGDISAHVHTHVPIEPGKPETLRKGPSTSDMAFSERVSVPVLLCVDDNLYEYRSASRGVIFELQSEFFGDPQATIRTAIDDESSEEHRAFWAIVQDMGIAQSDTAAIEQLKTRYARQEAGTAILRQVREATVDEGIRFTAFMIKQMSDAHWQMTHPGSYIKEWSLTEFDAMFNTPLE